SDIDLARARLIRDLREDFGVNDEGISVILHLVDQMHGLRRSMQGLLDEMRARGQPTDAEWRVLGAGLGAGHRIAPDGPAVLEDQSRERIMPNRRTRIIIALAGVMLLLGLGPGQTEDYPSRPVRLIIPTPAGSLVDVLGRLFAQDVSERLGQTIVVDNRPG